MFKLYAVRVTLIGEADRDIDELRQRARDLVRDSSHGDHSVVQLTETPVRPLDDTEAAAEALRLGFEPADLGLSDEGLRLQLAFDFND